MKRLPKYLLVSLLTFLIGLTAVAIWFLSKRQSAKSTENIPVIMAENPVAEVVINNQPSFDKISKPLDNAWIENDEYLSDAYKIKRSFISDRDGIQSYFLTVSRNGKVLAEFESGAAYKDHLRYGFFNFLGKKDKQLIVYVYSGGAHCCYDYIIYDLKPKFRVIYNSMKVDSANDIGNDLIPVDIDRDGVFELQRDVMAFDYFSPGGHATSTFPPTIFAYDKKQGKYKLATKKYPEYVLTEMRKNVDWLNKRIEENKYNKTGLSNGELNECIVRDTFLHLIYAGKETEAWKYYDDKYIFEYRNLFTKEKIEKILLKDPTYRSIYNK